MTISAYCHRVGASGLHKSLDRLWRPLLGRGLEVGLTVLACLLTAMVASAQGAAVPETPSGTAIRRIVEGNYSSAAQNLRRALEVTPDDALLNDAVGAISVCTSDPVTARTAFEHALRSDSNDCLA